MVSRARETRLTPICASGRIALSRQPIDMQIDGPIVASSEAIRIGRKYELETGENLCNRADKLSFPEKI